MTFTGNYAGPYEIHHDGHAFWLYCEDHEEFCRMWSEDWKLPSINNQITQHEEEWHET
jgi:hypothetical protein